MKTLVFSLLMLINLTVYAQNVSVDDIISKFDGKDGITSVVVSKDMLKIASDVKSDDANMSGFLGEISEIKILVLDSVSMADRDLFSSMVKKLPLNNYKELMTVKDGGQLVKMVIKENGNKISDFLLIVTGNGEHVLISITGDMDMKKLSGLAKTMNFSGFEHLAKLEKNKK